jgi:hypothetical protein
LKTYCKKGYGKEWINQRLKTIEIRKALTDEWEARGAKEGLEFAILTDEITKAWTGLTTREYKNLKDLKKENLRDNMTNLELVLNMLAETATTEISQKREPKSLGKIKRLPKKAEAWRVAPERILKKELAAKLLPERMLDISKK